MPMTNAERQTRYRKRRKAQGLKRKDAWQDRDGFTASASDGTSSRPRIEYPLFIRELKSLTGPMAEQDAEEIYAELLNLAQRLREK